MVKSALLKSKHLLEICVCFLLGVYVQARFSGNTSVICVNASSDGVAVLEGASKQMAVLNLNDVEHIPHVLCFLTSSLLFQSSVRNLTSSRTL